MPYIGERSGDVKNLDKLVPALEKAGVNYADLVSSLSEMSDADSPKTHACSLA